MSPVFGAQLRKWRHQRGWSREQLKRNLPKGISRRKIERWEDPDPGRRPPSKEETELLAAALDEDPQDVWNVAAGELIELRLRGDADLLRWHRERLAHLRAEGRVTPLPAATGAQDRLLRVLNSVGSTSTAGERHVELAATALADLVSYGNPLTFFSDLADPPADDGRALRERLSSVGPFPFPSDYVAWFVAAPPAVKARLLRLLRSAIDMAAANAGAANFVGGRDDPPENQ